MIPEVVVNARFLSRRVSGVERHGREILSLIGDRCRLVGTRSNGWRGHVWEQLTLPLTLSSRSVLWSPANTGPLLLSNQALTVHDLSPLEHPGWFRKSFAVWYRLLLPLLVRRVRVIFTPSVYVKEKISRRFKMNRILVTPNGVDRSFFHPSARQAKYALPRNYILFVGTLEPRKNLHGLLRAWEQVREEFREFWLIIAGTHGNVFEAPDLPPDMQRVRFLGYVEDEHLPGLYAGATAFVLPSFDEGFGLPALEAMACGAPVIVSDGGALAETVGEAGVIFQLADAQGISSALRECLAEDRLRCSMKERGLARAELFTWQKSADTVWNTLHEI